MEIVRYAITKILCWTPQEAMESMTPEIMSQLHLDRIATYIQFPKDLSRTKDYVWMIHKAFPKETSYDITKQIFQLYQKVKRGEFRRFPEEFLKEKTEVKNSQFCLKIIFQKTLRPAA